MIAPPCSQLIHIPSYNTGLKVLETVTEVRRYWQPVWSVIDSSTGGTGEKHGKYRIAIPKRIYRSAIPREGFDPLLCCPLRGRIFVDVDVDMNHVASGMPEDDQDGENFEVDRGKGKKVDRHEVCGAVSQGRPLHRRRWFARTYAIV